MTTETDRELLELAARAAGIELRGWYEGAMHADDFGAMLTALGTGLGTWWNPLTDDGDALRLAASLGLVVDFSRPSAGLPFTRHSYDLSVGGNDVAATRRAITRAAAEIGRAMK